MTTLIFTILGFSEQLFEYIRNMDVLDYFNAFIALLIVSSVIMGIYIIIFDSSNKSPKSR